MGPRPDITLTGMGAGGKNWYGTSRDGSHSVRKWVGMDVKGAETVGDGTESTSLYRPLPHTTAM